MKSNQKIWSCLAVLLSAVSGFADAVDHVDPYIGCSYNGHCFAAATTPFGLVQAGPDTGFVWWDYCSGYRYADTKILGFSQTHLSGTGCGDLGDILLMPFTGAVDLTRTNFASSYRKETQTATPGFYEVALDENKAKVKIAAKPRSAIYSFDYCGSETPRLFVDAQYGILNWSVRNPAERVIACDIRKDGDYAIVGTMETQMWIRRKFAFTLVFDRKITSWQDLPKRSEKEKASRFVLSFDMRPGTRLMAKFAISAKDENAAKRNLNAEIAGWDLEGVRKQARQAWNDVLSRVHADGNADELKTFYTSLYHLFIQPNNLADVGEPPFYSTFSYWDTFRAAHPLYTLLTPELVDGFIDSTLKQGNAQGYMPVWTLWGKDNNCMIGNHSIPVVVDAYLKGFRGFDANAAYTLIRKSLTEDCKGRAFNHTDDWEKFGYYPFDRLPCESVSRTLEHAYDDWCAAKFAEALGKKDDAAYFLRRANNWTNVFDRSVGFARGRDSKGNWRENFSPFKLNVGGNGIGPKDFTEGNSWQYTWHVMQDPYGLIAAMGGKEKLAVKLDGLFSQPEQVEGMGFALDATGLIGQYAHGNEPSHHTAYFYQFAGRGDRTAEIVREVCDRFYLPKPDGLCGNDDCGQMSAWYLFSAMGFYPFNPCGGDYVIGAPQLPKLEVKLANGKWLNIVARNLSRANKYVKSVTFNGKRIDGFILRHADLVKGGELVFDMCNGRKETAYAKGEKMRFAGIENVKVSDDFWSPRFERWNSKTIPDVFDKFEHKSRAITNFLLAANGAKSGHHGPFFFDGNLNEVIRGASDYLLRYPNPSLEERIDGIVDLIVAAQCPDGYLNTRIQITNPSRRWGDNGGFVVDQHEIYNAGCLIEAGVHYYRATGKDKLLKAGIRFADLLCRTIGPTPKRNLIPTHSLAEDAIIELARLMDSNPRLSQSFQSRDYLNLVKFWYDQHGHHCGAPDWRSLGWKVREEMAKMSAAKHTPDWRPSLGDYQMDRVPLSEYKSIEGHAVRAALMCSGLAAYAVESGESEYAKLATRFWESMIGRKLYISGGVGAEPKFEGFVNDYELPPNAYLETCAAIGSAFFSGNMAALTADGRYMDEFERVIYNALLTAVGEDGVTYTYVNPLNTEKGERWDWHGCPCCPPMFLKLTGALPGYAYGVGSEKDEIFVNLFIGGEANLNLADAKVRLATSTRYPQSGTVDIAISPESKRNFSLKIRIPGWSRGIENPFGLYRSNHSGKWSLAVNGERIDVKLEKGYAVLNREWKPGDKVRLELDVSERLITADDRVKEIRGKVARMRGPVLMANERGEWIPYEKVANHGACAHHVWVPNADYRLYNVVPMYIGHEREQAAKCVEMAERTGENLALYSLTLHPEGRPATAKVDRYVASFHAFADALKGTKVRAGVLVQAILGHWPRTDKDIEPWERTIDQNGKVVRFCPLDSGFGAYIDYVATQLAKEHPAFILTDDDVRAFSHGCECFCASHVALFNQRRGTKYDSNSLRQAVAKSKPGESDYDTFFNLQREMIRDHVIGRIRKAIDAVDPTIPAGVCIAGEEHWLCLPLAQKIAARGQTPVMRCSTGMYGERMTASGMPWNYLRMLGFSEMYGKNDVEMLDEADTCPQNLWSKSARSFMTHLIASCFVGMTGAKTWYVNTLRATGQPVSTAYTDVLADNRGLLDSLAWSTYRSSPIGLAVPVFTKPKAWHLIGNHWEFFVHGNAVAKALIPFGLPVSACADFSCRDVVFVLGDAMEVERMSDTELEQIFSGRVLVLRNAAKALSKRGKADLIGCSLVPSSAIYNVERDRMDNTSLSFTSTMDASGGSVVIEPLEGAETLSELIFRPYHGAKGEVVSPASVSFKNRLGGKAVTMLWHEGMMSLHQFSEERRRWLVSCIDRLTDHPIVYCGNEQDVLVSERSAQDGSQLLLAINLNSDPIRKLKLRIAGSPRITQLKPDGSWQPIQTSRNADFLLLDAQLGFYEATVLKVERK